MPETPPLNSCAAETLDIKPVHSRLAHRALCLPLGCLHVAPSYYFGFQAVTLMPVRGWLEYGARRTPLGGPQLAATGFGFALGLHLQQES